MHGRGVWHKHGVSRAQRPRPPLDRRRLEELALRYVGRFATTRRRLGDYLQRKLAERGWDEDEGAPDPDSLVERLAALGYVDDAAFATARGRSLEARGYGPRRVAGALRAAGIGEEDGADALAAARGGAVEAALRLARRRRIGPFAKQAAERAEREKWVATMVRAGHDFAIARKIADCKPGEMPEFG